MSLPTELIKPIDEIKTPSNRILVIALMLALIFAVGLYIRQVAVSDKEKNRQIEKRDHKIEMLEQIIRDKDAAASKKEAEDNIRLRGRDHTNDSLSSKLDYLYELLKSKQK